MEIKISDLELINKFVNEKDESSFSEIITRYSEKVHNLAMRITRNAEDTEEIMQDVFIIVYTKVHKFEGKSAFSSWLYRVTTNTAFMKLRKRRMQNTVSLDDSNLIDRNNWVGSRSENVDVNYISSQHEMRALIEAALAKLPDEYRTIFLLRDVDGLSNQEVGEILKITVPAVKSRLHRSRIMLRKKLKFFYQDYINDHKIFYNKKSSSELKLAA
jgi:RNA polymerase sigma-70 factor (ECF subfamily)